MMAFNLKTGDTSPNLQETLTDNDGEALILTDANVFFVMRDAQTGDMQVDKSANIIEANEGQVEYSWDPEDTDTPGMFFGEFQVEYSETEIETFPSAGYLIIEVDESVDYSE